MRFAIAANICDSRSTGMGRQMYGVGEALRARGHEVRYLFADTSGRRFGPRLSRLEFPWRVADVVRREAVGTGRRVIAIIHEPAAWVTALLAKSAGVHVVAMVHNCERKVWGLTKLYARETGQRIRWSSRILWPATELSQAWLSLKMAAQVFCLSSEDQEYITQEIGIPGGRVSRIDNGVEAGFLGGGEAIVDRNRDLLFLASWLPHKGIRQLVEALGLLARRGVTPTLTIAGAGKPEAEIRRDLPNPWRDAADVTAYVRPDELASLYGRHRILVLPSIFEGIPLTVLEAMACGLCVVASRVGGIPDVLEDGREGLLVPPVDSVALADTLLSLLGSPKAVADLGARARARAQLYSWQRVAAQVEAALSLAQSR